MSRTTLIRVAYVKFSPTGKSYVTRCDREDITEGHEVEVLMHAGTTKAYYIEGVVTLVSHQRWNCSCHTVNHACEVEYMLDDNGHLNRKINLTNEPVSPIDERKAQINSYVNTLPESSRDEMRAIYEAVAHEDSEVAYLSDGVWIRPDGSLDDRGR